MWPRQWQWSFLLSYDPSWNYLENINIMRRYDWSRSSSFFFCLFEDSCYDDSSIMYVDCWWALVLYIFYSLNFSGISVLGNIWYLCFWAHSEISWREMYIWSYYLNIYPWFPRHHSQEVDNFIPICEQCAFLSFYWLHITNHLIA